MSVCLGRIVNSNFDRLLPSQHISIYNDTTLCHQFQNLILKIKKKYVSGFIKYYICHIVFSISILFDLNVVISNAKSEFSKSIKEMLFNDCVAKHKVKLSLAV